MLTDFSVAFATVCFTLLGLATNHGRRHAATTRITGVSVHRDRWLDRPLYSDPSREIAHYPQASNAVS